MMKPFLVLSGDAFTLGIILKSRGFEIYWEYFTFLFFLEGWLLRVEALFLYCNSHQFLFSG